MDIQLYQGMTFHPKFSTLINEPNFTDLNLAKNVLFYACLMRHTWFIITEKMCQYHSFILVVYINTSCNIKYIL